MDLKVCLLIIITVQLFSELGDAFALKMAMIVVTKTIYVLVVVV
jgi:hypothetical protein